jgi:A/G-specific adenine glycosylase
MARRELPLTTIQVRSLRRALLRWYDANRRDLPWRRDQDPYRVWVSEIMLQQTRVAAVLDHYARFMRRFPAVQSLASAREASVLAVWSGLGYYHRARRMHRAAKIIAQQRRGEFPQTAADWAELPGIGRYTAAAIASIAFGEAVATLDGNVERVLQRISGGSLGREVAWQHSEALLDRKRPGDFNQAMMELGATICTPRAPRCLRCPVVSFCVTRGAEATAPSTARKQRELSYALARRKGAVLLVRRPLDSALMAGMWELPMLSPGLINGDAPLLRLRHSITDTDYHVAVFAAAADRLTPKAEWKWCTSAQCRRLPLTGLARKILHRVTIG